MHFLKIIEWSPRKQDINMLGNHVFWRLMLFYTHLLLLLEQKNTVLWLSIVTFNNDAKPPQSEFDVSPIGPRLGGLPHLERLHGKI